MTALTKIHKLYRTKVKPLASFIIALIVLIVYFYYSFASHRTPTGDEPHYVLATISLIKDHDLNLLNNYIDQDYLDFGQYATLRHACARIPKRYLISCTQLLV